jgi:hypothetical protein
MRAYPGTTFFKAFNMPQKHVANILKGQHDGKMMVDKFFYQNLKAPYRGEIV